MSKKILFITYSALDGYDGSSMYLRDFFLSLKEYDVEIHICSMHYLHTLFLKKIDCQEYYSSVSVFGWHQLGSYHYRLFPIKELVLRLRKWIACNLTDKLDPSRKFVNTLKGIFGKASSEEKNLQESLPEIDSVKMGSFICKCCERIQPNILIFNYAHMLRFLPMLPRMMVEKTVVITHDLMFLRKLSFQKQSLFDGMTQKTELALLQLADIIVMIQKEETAVIQSLLPNKQYITCPISAEIFPQHTRKGEKTKGKLLFVGSKAVHNKISIRYFIREILPEIRKAHPEVVLHVVGSVCFVLDDLRGTPGLLCRGIVDDLSIEYKTAHACIIPLLAGSGLKIKLMEALAYGGVRFFLPLWEFKEFRNMLIMELKSLIRQKHFQEK